MDGSKLHIEDCETFEEVAANKQHAFEVNKASQLNIDRILADLYTDPTHFIFELIQNAEDAEATKVSIVLDARRLIFRHDGRPFDLRDLKGITSVNYSPKADDYTKIGRFGIGFKAVFGICDEPEIFSGEYSFKIRNFYVPEKVSPRAALGTEIVLNFKQETREQIYSEIEKKLVAMRPDTLLFLRHIRQIDYQTETKCGYYRREKIAKRSGQRAYYESRIIGREGTLSRYLMFEAPLDHTIFSAELLHNADPLYVSVAYRVGDGNGQIVSDGESTKLVVYFPTERETHLQFKINGPFRTTPTRENIPFTPENGAILNAIVSLYQESILTIKESGLLTPSFCEMLPLVPRKFDADRADPIYEAFQTATKQLFFDEKLLPAKDGGFTDPSAAVLARGPIADLLDREDLEVLFDGRTQWLSTDITERYRNFYLFVRNVLKVKEVDFDTFMSASDRSFFLRKSNEWLAEFYKRANSSWSASLERYLTKEFIKTQSGDIVAPFTGRQNARQKNVYLPSKLISDRRRIVDEELVKDKEILNFFMRVGIEPMDIVESIRTQWIPSLHRCESEEAYVTQVEDLYLEYLDQGPRKQEDLLDLLRSNKIVYCCNENGDRLFLEPCKVFMQDTWAETLYGGCEEAVFLPPLLAEAAEKDGGLSELLKKLGVCTGVMLVKQYNTLSYNERRAIMKDADHSRYIDEGFQIGHLNYILENMTQERSKALWQALNALSSKDFKGELKWWYYNNSHTREFDAPFVKILQKNEWLYDKQGRAVAPADICEEEVRELYGGGNALRYFKFKPDIIKSLPAEQQEILELVKGHSPEEVRLALELLAAQDVSAPHAIDIDPEEAPAVIVDAVFSDPLESMTAEELVASAPVGTSDRADGEVPASLHGEAADMGEVAQYAVVKQTSNEAQAIGALGEKAVLAALKREYRKDGYAIYDQDGDGFSAKRGEEVYDVKRQNSAVKTQKGYDISVSQSGNILQYIEVKTKKSDEKEYFTVSGTQWEFAKKLHREGKGKKHFVYVVTNIEDVDRITITRIPDPYAAWLDGRIEADPVRIKY